VSSCGCEITIDDKVERRSLIALLTINAAMFVAEMVAGIISDSTALIADSLDMFADASVYALSLYAVGRSVSLKVRAAFASGVMQILLGMLVLFEVARRFVFGSEPEPAYMIGVGFAALVANVICLKLIARHRQGGVHMRASWIFSRNDVIANIGVILAGALVAYSGSHYPDLIIGQVVALIVVWGGVRIIQEVKAERHAHINRE